MSFEGRREEMHGHSGWLIPLVFVGAILILSGLFLGWYLRPGPRASAPTGKSDMVRLSVRGQPFAIPANYIESAGARAGGDQDQLALAALFPSWRGYSDNDARLFSANAPDSPVIRITLRADANNLAPGDRLARIYKPYVVKPAGAAGPFGLTQYSFRKDSGYEQNDLFVGERAGPVLLLCERAGEELVSPNCLAVDRPLAGSLGGRKLSLSYRFKRAYLARWREMADGVDALVRKFETD
ncbi:MAG TPA: hypothetical protein VG821_03865 [Rhizomicrobium sp.]|jgi:hypothetical protein|nr:hypothetical protein [Rhizomicrobium sp.]